MNISEVNELFSQNGGKFITPSFRIAEKLPDIICLIFDWDGVFNNGQKSEADSSPFAEVDSMGINMLRFSYYLKYGIIPACFIITGENNPLAIKFAKREKFNGVYFRAKDKAVALGHIREVNKIHPDHCIFFFDDILDLDVASIVRLGMMIGRNSNPLLNELVSSKNLADYITSNPGGQGGLREACELLIGLNQNYDDVITKRIEYSGTYLEYITNRNKIKAHFYEFKEGEILTLPIS